MAGLYVPKRAIGERIDGFDLVGAVERGNAFRETTNASTTESATLTRQPQE